MQKKTMDEKKTDLILSLGDIVSFSTKDYEFGLAEITTKIENHITTYKIGDARMNSPLMVVIEIVLEDAPNAHLFDEKTGKPLRDKYKILCQWYSQKTGKFEERWFNQSVLNKIETNNTPSLSSKDITISQKVILKTANLSSFQLDKIKNTFASITPDFTGNIIHETSKIFDYLQFTPPAMAIIGVEKDEKLTTHNKKTGHQNRWISTDKIKCMWYDYTSGKFSENFFSPDALSLLVKSEISQ